MCFGDQLRRLLENAPTSQGPSGFRLLLPFLPRTEEAWAELFTEHDHVIPTGHRRSSPSDRGPEEHVGDVRHDQTAPASDRVDASGASTRLSVQGRDANIAALQHLLTAFIRAGDVVRSGMLPRKDFEQVLRSGCCGWSTWKRPKVWHRWEETLQKLASMCESPSPRPSLFSFPGHTVTPLLAFEGCTETTPCLVRAFLAELLWPASQFLSASGIKIQTPATCAIWTFGRCSSRSARGIVQ